MSWGGVKEMVGEFTATVSFFDVVLVIVEGCLALSNIPTYCTLQILHSVT